MKVSIKQYSQALYDLTENKSEQEVSDIVKKIAKQLKKDGQLKNAGKIMDKFNQIYNQKHGIVQATIVTRQTSESLNVKEIEEFIAKKYDAKKVELKFVVDERIKGGIIIKVGDEVIDGSVKKQLTNLKRVLYS